MSKSDSPLQAATSARRRMLALPPQAEALRQELHRSFEEALASAEALVSPDCDSPHLLREKAWSSALKGEFESARTTLQLSISTSESYGLKLELLRCYEEQYELAPLLDLSRPDSLSKIEVLASELEVSPQVQVVEQRNRLALVSQMEGLIDHGRTLARALSLTELREALQKAQGALFGDSEGGLYHLDGTPYLARESDGPDSDILKRTLKTGRTQLGGWLGGVKSQFCTPMFLAGEIRYLFWLSRERKAGRVGSREVALAEYLASILETALTNIQRLERLKTAREEVQLRAERHHALFNNSPSANAEISAEGAVLEANPTWKALGITLEWWEAQSDGHVFWNQQAYLRKTSTLRDGGRILTLSPLPLSRSSTEVALQTERLDFLNSQVKHKAVAPLTRMVQTLNSCEGLSGLSPTVEQAKVALDSIMDLIQELESERKFST